MSTLLAPAPNKSNYLDGERWFRRIVEASPYAILVVDGDFRIAFANQRAEKLFGYSRMELAGLDIHALIPSKYRASHAVHISQYMRRPSSRSIIPRGHLRGQRKDGGEIPLEIGLDPIQTPEGQFILASIMDITGKRFHEEALQLAVEAAPNAMLMVDAKGQIALANREAEKLFYYKRDELLNKPYQLLIPERFRALDPRLLTKYLDNPWTRAGAAWRDLFGRRKDGSEVPIEIGLNTIETPKGRFVLASMIDITERWRYEDELRRSQQEAIEGRQRAEHHAVLLRRIWEEVTALAIRCGLPGAETAPAALLEACRSDANLEDGLARILSPFETAFRGYANANKLLADQNDALAAAKAVTDASNHELEAFSYSVAHDLRAPLRTIDGFCQILEEEYADKLDPTGKGHFARVRSAAQHMGSLIDSLLGLARITQGHLSRSEVNLSAMANHLRDNLLSNAPNRTAEFSIAPGLVVDGNTRLLRVVLENLFSNAWKFTAKAPIARIEFGAEPTGDETVYFVRDNGVGFDMKYAGKLFGAFQRLHNARDFPGNGIGLATVQRIVTKHGGRIWAESSPGNGATFRFVLPSGGA